MTDPGSQQAVVAARRSRRPVALLTVSYLVAAVLALPLVFLLIEAHGVGWSELAHLIFRPLTGSLLWNTVRLTVVVTMACAVIGTAAAWCVERTDLPGRRVWAVLVVVPLAIPDFVVGFGWNSLWTWAHGFRGSVIVMTLAVYPLVYLPVAASLRSADPGQEEVARSLGSGKVRTFVRVTLGAFALSYFTERYAAGFGYGTAMLLIVCYAIMFFPLALVGVKASLARAPVSLDEMARSLGQRKLAVLCRVSVRLAGPGLVAAFCLVFLSAVTELTATLLLIPTGTQTLATQFWAYESNLCYSQAAPFALVMIIIAAVPSYVLGRFFNRSAQAQG